MIELADKCKLEKEYLMILSKIPFGAFEIYFMGVRLFSKNLSKNWPNVDDFVEKFNRILRDYNDGGNIQKYEF